MKVLTVVGARPQFVKAAPVSRAFAGRVEEVLVHTGQHYDESMSDVFFRELGLAAPAHNLGVGSGGHGAQTGEMLKRLEPIMQAEQPDVVLVYGDTNSTLAGALAAAKLHIPVAHVEAGVRSYNRRMPEEVNRVTTDHLATWLFCTSESAAANLAKEGITRGVHVVGDVMEEVFRAQIAKASQDKTTLPRLGLKERSYVVATIHRAENTDDPTRLRHIVDGLEALAVHRRVILPLHPRTAKCLASQGIALRGVTGVPPVGHQEMITLLANAAVAVTDSGGLQKEAAWAGIPCVVVREETEWHELVTGGWTVLSPPSDGGLVSAVDAASAAHPGKLAGPPDASARIASLLASPPPARGG